MHLMTIILQCYHKLDRSATMFTLGYLSIEKMWQLFTVKQEKVVQVLWFAVIFYTASSLVQLQMPLTFTERRERMIGIG